MSKDFEAMKAGKLAIWPWLSCPYNENTLVDLPSSVDLTIHKYKFNIYVNLIRLIRPF